MRVILPNVKAHIAVAMVAFLVTSLAMEDMPHEGVIHHSSAMELPNTERQLRSSPGMTSHGGERRLTFNIEGVSTTAEVMKKFVADTKMWWWRQTGDSDTLFTYLKLEVKVGLFSKPEFIRWANDLYAKYGDDSSKMMTATILRQSDDVTAAKVIFDTDSYPRVDLRSHLLDDWEKRKGTPETLLNRLFPGGNAESLFDNSLLSAWRGLADKHEWNEAQRFACLTTKFGAVDLVMAMAKGHNLNVMNAGQPFKREAKIGHLYVRQLHVWRKAGKSEEEVGELLKLESADTSTLLASTWLDYVLVRATDKFNREVEEDGFTRYIEDKDESTRLKNDVLQHLEKSPVKKLLESKNIAGPLLIWKEKLLSEDLNVLAWQAKGHEVVLTF